MRTGKKGTNWVQLWKRNAVVAAVALFVCAAVYLNWSYDQQAQAGKTQMCIRDRGWRAACPNWPPKAWNR